MIDYMKLIGFKVSKFDDPFFIKLAAKYIGENLSSFVLNNLEDFRVVIKAGVHNEEIRMFLSEYIDRKKILTVYKGEVNKSLLANRIFGKLNNRARKTRSEVLKEICAVRNLDSINHNSLIDISDLEDECAHYESDGFVKSTKEARDLLHSRYKKAFFADLGEWKHKDVNRYLFSMEFMKFDDCLSLCDYVVSSSNFSFGLDRKLGKAGFLKSCLNYKEIKITSKAFKRSLDKMDIYSIYHDFIDYEGRASKYKTNKTEVFLDVQKTKFSYQGQDSLFISTGSQQEFEEDFEKMVKKSQNLVDKYFLVCFNASDVEREGIDYQQALLKIMKDNSKSFFCDENTTRTIKLIKTWT